MGVSGTPATWFRAQVAPERGSGLLEHQPVVLEQLALEADAVGADARGECQAELGARQPPRHELELQQPLTPARPREARTPLLDRLDVVEPAARALDEPEI